MSERKDIANFFFLTFSQRHVAGIADHFLT